jgi:hypothetical protein
MTWARTFFADSFCQGRQEAVAALGIPRVANTAAQENA